VKWGEKTIPVGPGKLLVPSSRGFRFLDWRMAMAIAAKSTKTRELKSENTMLQVGVELEEMI
jgi:hypothetical protein